MPVMIPAITVTIAESFLVMCIAMIVIHTVMNVVIRDMFLHIDTTMTVWITSVMNVVIEGQFQVTYTIMHVMLTAITALNIDL